MPGPLAGCIHDRAPPQKAFRFGDRTGGLLAAREIMIRVPKLLASLLLSSELLFVLAVGCAVDTEARIRATVAAGETVVAAIASYTREHGRAPARLDILVPRYLRSIPQPVYGLRSWEYSAHNFQQTSDDRMRVELALPSAPTDPQAKSAYALAVLVDPAHPEWRFRRRNDGCWQLPETLRCW